MPLNKDALSTDETYMLRCLQIAKNGLGFTAPNPMVGAVIVHDNKIIGEGYTSAYGGSHAEVNAINSVSDVSLLKSSTIYVTLEPCSHYGKTPPCADLIVKMGIPRVVIALKDPHEKVAGKGIKKLEDAGCTVQVGILQKECEEHHKRFLTFFIKKRPYIILKWAETADGFIAPDSTKRGEEKKPYWITNTKSRQLVHKWRSEEAGILVGTNTVLADNPQLNLRDWAGKTPTRIILDRKLKISKDFHVLDGKQNTIVCTELADSDNFVEGVNYKVLDFSTNLPQQLCKVMHEEQIQSVIIEGGLQTLQSFIEAGLWDEARIFKGANTFSKGITAPKVTGRTLKHIQILTDQLTIIRND
ncbi:bifunctional diaminohydroxyphosphoribosylaminopyrimidine deaminase/5-amino-6-(5-phosphoribosylamino)uracil reductase RibD [Maribacter sp. SA7]|uniref:bifunctional diaminohydroxyphosphoribosylaminopyrimidine deaminase/5-amino-6-(5-phosphoribosylamino)uracil reductase RibD n=1 Tax=Maribacter zhoushanensis TaxID=3030012 RepID=UPI0023EE262A|nr:bifunctional diaminohydroxyphosphoribosylaminopyrimidine deaminase/5-amino-6-(5-phosphoribosylamino)uracil reductase RibD [Maribacter zhoushanensis]MDF4202755.1 bifunctional diaminohydroxyphosphoribosylaminopyrimidine deaminase/5-amino-6-(5-phosphoribosylamino)uracil reductase RibD [Maribacter zhoushanensis]